MAKNKKLNETAEKIGAAIGKADRTAHRFAEAGLVAKEELAEISKQVESLRRQLEKTAKRLKRALD